MTNRFCRQAALAVAILALVLASGCAESTRPQANGKGWIRGINSIVTSPELLFRIEERAVGNVNFRGAAGFEEWDGLTYNFNFDLLLPGVENDERIATQTIDVANDIEYTLVLTGTLDNASIQMWEVPVREWSGTETVFEADFIHLSPVLGQVDVYFALEGTTPVLGNQVGTLSNGDRIPYLELPEGDYELILTAPGDPSTVVFQSSPFTRTPVERVSLALFDPDPSITAPVGVNIFFPGGAAQTLADINSPPIVRTLHAAFGTENFDGYFGEDFGNVIYPNVGFGELSNFVETTEILTPLTLTAVGDANDVIYEVNLQFIGNTRRTVVLFGEPDGLLEGDLFTRPLLHDGRPLATFPVVRITNFSTNIAVLDIYEVDPGTVLDETVFPKFGGSVLALTTGFFDTPEGLREFVITRNGEKDPISEPVVLDLANGNVVDMVILDTVNPSMVEMRVFETIP